MRAFTALSSLLLAASALASHNGLSRRHHELASRKRGDMSKRFGGARFTFYDVGLGACGKHNVASDFVSWLHVPEYRTVLNQPQIVALNTAQYGGGYPGPQCFKSITITANGKSAQATIMDECPTCPFGALDLSRGLFEHLAGGNYEDIGVIHGSWTFNDGSGGGTVGGDKGGDDDDNDNDNKHDDDDDDKPKPKPSPKPEPEQHAEKAEEKPKTTSHKTTSSEKPKPTTSKKTTTTSHKPTSTSEKPVSTSSSASVKSSAPAATPAAGKNLADLNQAILSMAGLVVDN